MNKYFGTAGSVAVLLLGSSVVFAHDLALDGAIEVPGGSAGYVNAGGEALRTSDGHCLKLGKFSEETQINACEGIEETAEAEPEAAPEAEPAPAPEPIKKEPIVTTATLGGEALFDNNSAELNAASQQALSDLTAELGKFQEISSISVIGHTDSSGEADYNQSLSERRAAAVEAFLASAYPNVQVSSSGMGEDSPVATNSNREGRQLNRRVEVQVTAKSITE
jgi:OOP family OmpA-OmpF porin